MHQQGGLASPAGPHHRDSFARRNGTADIVQGDAALGPEHAEPPGIKPSRGPRQRLDRYDDKDFDDYEDAMRAMGLWKVDDAPEYHGGAARIRLGPDYYSGKDEPRSRRRG